MLGKITATLVQGEKEMAEPVYVVKGQGDTALLDHGAAEHNKLWVVLTLKKDGENIRASLDMTDATPS